VVVRGRAVLTAGSAVRSHRGGAWSWQQVNVKEELGWLGLMSVEMSELGLEGAAEFGVPFRHSRVDAAQGWAEEVDFEFGYTVGVME